MSHILRYVLTLLLLSLALPAQSGSPTAFGASALEQLHRVSQVQYLEIQDQDRRYERLIEDQEKFLYFSESFGALLENRIINNQIINGHELNLLAQTLKTYLHLADESVRMQNDFRLKRSLRDRTPLFASPDFYKNDLMEVHILRTRIEITHTIFSTYFSERILRTVINNQSNWDGYEINNIRSRIRNYLDRDHIMTLEGHYSSILPLQRELLSNPDTSEITEQLISSESYQRYFLGNELSVYSDIDSILTRTSDQTLYLADGLLRLLSRGFGTVAGNIKWRRGRLENNPDVLEKIYNLQPLDLLFEKKRFLLTDQTIPGHWGHVGIWLGTEQQWRELGIWNREELSFFQEQIENGNSIYEVRRWGMQFDTAENFSNLDEIAALRVGHLIQQGSEKIVEVLLNLESQMGKRYDFGFDVMAADRITCTELITFSYGPIQWPYDRRVGRYTITPNNIGELLFYTDGPLEFVFYAIGDSNKNYIEKDMRDFARELGFYEHRKTGQFHQEVKHCENTFYRRGGRGPLRVDRRCETNFIHHQYVYEIE